jgi:hypothetical protein
MAFTQQQITSATAVQSAAAHDTSPQVRLVAGPNWIYIKFNRATTLYTKTRDKEAFRKDLEWLIAQDPRKANSPYPANVWFQAKAKEMLANTDEYF